MNLAAADGQMWRKHRRVVGPAFGTELLVLLIGSTELALDLECRYKLVWRQTAQTYQDMVETEGWKTKDVVDVPVIQALTLKVIVRFLCQSYDPNSFAQLAFLIISTCGFGFPSTWFKHSPREIICPTHQIYSGLPPQRRRTARCPCRRHYARLQRPICLCLLPRNGFCTFQFLGEGISRQKMFPSFQRPQLQGSPQPGRRATD